jgi:hypothetical protein
VGEGLMLFGIWFYFCCIYRTCFWEVVSICPVVCYWGFQWINWERYSKLCNYCTYSWWLGQSCSVHMFCYKLIVGFSVFEPTNALFYFYFRIYVQFTVHMFRPWLGHHQGDIDKFTSLFTGPFGIITALLHCFRLLFTLTITSIQNFFKLFLEMSWCI